MRLLTSTSLVLAQGVVALARAVAHDRRDFSSSNWCGQVLSGSNFNEVSARWIMPKSSPLPTQYRNQPMYNYQWVGIDGASSSCQAILQAGTYARLINNSLTYGFWYEFYPNGSWLLDEPTVNPGDSIYIKITATSSTTGIAYMSNESTGQNTTINLTAPSGSSLCFATAEWIQENSGGSAATFAPFSTFSFDKCAATDSNGASYDLTNSEKWLMNPSGQQLCYPSDVTSTSVQINYSGPTN